MERISLFLPPGSAVFRRRLTSLLLLPFLAFAPLGANAELIVSCDSGFTELNYDLENITPEGGVAVARYPFGLSGKVIVPDKIYVTDTDSEMTVTYTVTRIASGAFENLDVSEVVLPESIVGIGDYAFRNCRRLGEIYLNDGLKTIGQQVFPGTSLREIEFPASIEEISGSDKFGPCWRARDCYPETLASISFRGESERYTIYKGLLYNKDMTSLYYCPKSLVPDDYVSAYSYIWTFPETVADFYDLPTGLTGFRYCVFPKSMRRIYASSTTPYAHVRLSDYEDLHWVSTEYFFASQQVPEPMGETDDDVCFLPSAGSFYAPADVIDDYESMRKATHPNFSVIEAYEMVPKHIQLQSEFKKMKCGVTFNGQDVDDITVEPLQPVTIKFDMCFGYFRGGNCRDDYRWACYGEAFPAKPDGESEYTFIPTVNEYYFGLDLPSSFSVTDGDMIMNFSFLETPGEPQLTSVTTDGTDVSIPGTVSYNGGNFKVTSINGRLPSNVKNVTIPAEVRTIYSLYAYGAEHVNFSEGLDSMAYSFNNSNLLEVNLPRSLREAYECFNGCNSLKSASFANLRHPNSLFCECSALTDVIIPSAVESVHNCLYYSPNVHIVVEESETALEGLRRGDAQIDGSYDPELFKEAPEPYRKVTTYRPLSTNPPAYEVVYARPGLVCNSFAGDTVIQKVTIAADVPAQAFVECPYLEEVTINGGNIGQLAFAYTPRLSRLTFSESPVVPIDSIAPGAFNYCTALENVELPASLLYIGHSAFQGARSLKRIVIPEGVNMVDHLTFAGCNQLEYFELPASATFLANTAFRHCPSLRIVRFNGASDGISRAASCESLKLGTGIFKDCPIETLYLNRVFTSKVPVFFGSSTLKRLDIGADIESLNPFAFGDCGSLETIVCYRDTPPALGTGAFRGVDTEKCTVHVLSGTEPDYRAADGWKDFFDITGAVDDISDDAVEIFASQGSVVVTGIDHGTVEIYGPSGKYLREVKITSMRTEIPMPRGYYIVCAGRKAKKIANL